MLWACPYASLRVATLRASPSARCFAPLRALQAAHAKTSTFKCKPWYFCKKNTHFAKLHKKKHTIDKIDKIMNKNDQYG